MELEIYQVVILLTTLFSGSDARPAASRDSRQNAVIRLQQSFEYPYISQVQKTQDYGLSRQGTLRKRSLAVKKALQSTIERKSVIQRLQHTGQFRKEFFSFPSKSGHGSYKSNLPTFEIMQKTMDNADGLIRRKAAAKFSKIRGRKIRRRRYSLEGTRWYLDTITWNVPSGAWSTRLSISDVNNTLTRAFRIWAEVIPLVFRWVDQADRANITVKFATGSHGCPNSFDGSGGVLAHAYYPGNGGDIHFDDAEQWTTSAGNSNSRILLPVAVHEIGHSLGLHHSSASGSMMSQYYSALNNNVVLSDDDVDGIQAIYGTCDTRVIGIESWMGNGRSYIFNSDNFWRINDNTRESERGFPKAVSSGWKGVPDDIDEIFLWGHNWKTYFFKDDLYYKYNDFYDTIEAGYPQQISVGWPGIPDDIDAAFTWSNYVSYFFKGDKVYKYHNRNDRVAPGYPRNISEVWHGIPNNLDSVFRYYYDGLTYFFKDDSFWRWDDVNNVAHGPYLTATKWKNICTV